MTDTYKTLDDVFIPEGDPATKNLDEYEEQATEAKELGLVKSEILRIEEGVDVEWSGVTGCCDDDRIAGACKAAYDKWVGDKMREHQQLRWIRHGYPAATVSCRSGRNPWPHNDRWCASSVTLQFYIEFRQP